MRLGDTKTQGFRAKNNLERLSRVYICVNQFINIKYI